MSYQQADANAVMTMIELLSQQLYGSFAERAGSRTDAEDLLQDAWLRIHRVRHTHHPGGSHPSLGIRHRTTHRVGVDIYRRRRRIESHEKGVDGLSEASVERDQARNSQSFDELLTAPAESQHEVLRLLKVNRFTIEEVARATSSTAGAVKQKIHRAYERLLGQWEQPLAVSALIQTRRSVH